MLFQLASRLSSSQWCLRALMAGILCQTGVEVHSCLILVSSGLENSQKCDSFLYGSFHPDTKNWSRFLISNDNKSYKNPFLTNTEHEIYEQLILMWQTLTKMCEWLNDSQNKWWCVFSKLIFSTFTDAFEFRKKCSDNLLREVLTLLQFWKIFT